MLFCGAGMLVSKLLRPHHPNYEKLQPYECGEESDGSPDARFNMRYYVVALIFILFSAELVFMFPWARVYAEPELMRLTKGRWGLLMLAEMGVFIGLLALGLAWAWAKGHLEWLRPVPESTEIPSEVPAEMYRDFNLRIKNRVKAAAVPLSETTPQPAAEV